VALKRADEYEEAERWNLSALSADAAGQLDVLRHDGDTLGVNGAEIGVFKKTYHISFTCFLHCKDGLALESQIRFVLLSDFSYQTLEGQLSDQEFG